MTLTLIFAILFSLKAFAPEAVSAQRDKTFFETERYLFLQTIYSHSFTPELLNDALYYTEIICPEVVYKQALLETGYFTSPVFYWGNNLFGIRKAKVRETTAVGEYDHHAQYNHWFDSVKDYVLLQDWYLGRGRALGQYYTFLEDIGYATDRNYINKLKNII